MVPGMTIPIGAGSSRTQSTKPPIPGLIKRNTIFLAIGQAVVSSGFQLIPTVGTLIMLRMTGSLALVGFTSGILGLTRLSMSYPAGKISDSRGRRQALLLGLAIVTLGSVLIFLSVVTNNFWLFIAGILIHGLGQGTMGQMNIAAADMYPVQRKAEGVSYVMTGGVIGALGGPLIVMYSTGYATEASLDPYSTPWLFTPFLALTSAIMVFLTRPDPREIAKKLEKYYPNIPIHPPRSESEDRRESVFLFFSSYPVITALMTTALTWGNMSMMMALVSVVLHHHGFDLTSVSVSVAIHVLGMYALSIPLGRMADRWGRRKILMAGSSISAVGAFTTTLTGEYWLITLGIFVVGVGWSAAFVTSTAVIGDVCPPTVRGRIQGSMELIAGICSLSFPIFGGFISNIWGFPVLGLVGILASAPTLVAASYLREMKPGIYIYKAPFPR